MTAPMDLEPIVAIEFRDDGFRYCPSCGTKAVARQYDDTVRTVAQAETVLTEVNDGCAWTAGYPYGAEVIPSTVRSLGGLSLGQVAVDQCHSCDAPLPGGVPWPQLDGLPMEHYFFAADDPLTVFWPPQRTGPRP